MGSCCLCSMRRRGVRTGMGRIGRDNAISCDDKGVQLVFTDDLQSQVSGARYLYIASL